jgi:hypothetical protein
MMEESKKPAVTLPMDADGRSIPLDTEVLYSGPDKVKVLSFSYYPLADYWTVDHSRSDSCSKRCLSTELRLSPPDSWDKLLGDLDRATNCEISACCYASNAEEPCKSCKFNRWSNCVGHIFADIADRIRTLRGKEQ